MKPLSLVAVASCLVGHAIAPACAAPAAWPDKLETPRWATVLKDVGLAGDGEKR